MSQSDYERLVGTFDELGITYQVIDEEWLRAEAESYPFDGDAARRTTMQGFLYERSPFVPVAVGVLVSRAIELSADHNSSPAIFYFSADGTYLGVDHGDRVDAWEPRKDLSTVMANYHV